MDFADLDQKQNAYIHLKSDAIDVQFVWLDFDGDDCFNQFHIDVTTETGSHRFEFGPCVLHLRRKLSRFFADETQPTVSGGFRHPDIRYFDVYRAEDGYRLVIRFEGIGLREEFLIQNPWDAVG